MRFVVVFAAGLAAEVVVLGAVVLELFLPPPPHPAASAARQRASAGNPKIFVGSFMAIPSFALAGPPANPDICGDEIVAAGTRRPTRLSAKVPTRSRRGTSSSPARCRAGFSRRRRG